MKLDSAVFSTDGIKKESERLELYQQNMQGVFLTEMDKDSKRGLSAHMNSYFLDEIILVDVYTVAQIFYRNERKIADDNFDHFFVQLFLEGGTEGLGKHDGLGGDRETIFFIDSSRPWKAYNPKFHTISLIVPRSSLGSRVGGLHNLHGYSLPIKGNPYAKLFNTFVLGLYRDIAIFEKDSAPVLSKNCIDLLAAALRFRDKNSFDTAGESNMLGIEIKKYIQRNISDKNLSVDSLVKKFSISRSSLYRIFPETNGGVSGFIKSRRLNLAYRSLASGAKGTNVSEVAYKCGFKNSSSFSRAFKERFEAAPVTLLRSAAKGETNQRELDHLKWHDWLEIIS